MARTKKRRSRGGPTLPLGIIGGLVPAGADIISAWKMAGPQAAIEHVALVTTGYDPSDGQWKPSFALQKLYGPLALGWGVHTIASRLGINRALARTGIPFVRI